MAIDCRRPLGVPAAFRQPQSLSLPSSRWIQAAAVDFDLRGVEIDRVQLRRRRNGLPDRLPDVVAAPPPTVLINGIPTGAPLLNRTPSTAFTQHK